jgi:hypothetical protein
MTTSRSIGSVSSRAARLFAFLVVAACVLALARPALAEKVVVLDFTGPKAAKFQVDVVKALRKGNTIVPAARWKRTARGLKATKVNDRNVKKVAKKMKVDAVVTGSVSRRGTRYRVQVVMRSGKTGDSIAEVEVTAKKAKFSAREISDIKAQLLPALDEMGGGGESVASRDDGDDESGAGNGFKGQDSDEMRGRDRVGEDGDAGSGDETAATDETETPPAEEEDRTRVAARDQESSGGGAADAAVRGMGASAPEPLGMRNAAVDVTAGLSMSIRNLDFDVVEGTENAPQKYTTNPVAGAFVAADIYPMAFGHKNKSFLSNFAVTLLFDRVIKLDSEVEVDGETVSLPTTQQHYAAGIQYRQPLGQSLWLEAGARYNRFSFEIDEAGAEDEVNVPDTDYAYIDPSIGARYLISPKISAGLEIRVPLSLDAGQIDDSAADGGLGAATLTAFEVEAAGDYLITRNIFARLGARFSSFSFDFEGNQVTGASDTYYGGYLVAGYLY